MSKLSKELFSAFIGGAIKKILQVFRNLFLSHKRIMNSLIKLLNFKKLSDLLLDRHFEEVFQVILFKFLFAAGTILGFWRQSFPTAAAVIMKNWFLEENYVH